MRKSARFMKAAGCLLLWFSLAGCAYSDILNEIPRDFAFPAQTSPASAEPQGSAPGQQFLAEQPPQDSTPEPQDSVEPQQDSVPGLQDSVEQPPQGSAPEAQSSSEPPTQDSASVSQTSQALSRGSVQGGAVLQKKASLGESFLAEEADDFACRSLSEAEKVWYHEMEAVLGSFGEKVYLSKSGLQAGLGEKDIDRIFQCVLNDHPELFYVEGYSYVKYSREGVLTAVTFSGTYSMDRETALLRREEIESAAAEILAGIPAEASDYDKVKYVYETLITSTDYELQAPDNQNIYSVLVNRRSVCQGYAKATQYLLNRLGVECTLVLGTVENGEGHAWNLVNIDGSYYYVDTTWGDASYQLGDAGDGAGSAMPAINYDYLNITTQELARTHTVGGVVPMPPCTANEANYYVREGAWFEYCDSGQLSRLFEQAAAESRMDVAVKCADAACYGEVVDFLIHKQKIFDLWKAAGTHIAYAQNEDQLSLTFWMTND